MEKWFVLALSLAALIVPTGALAQPGKKHHIKKKTPVVSVTSAVKALDKAKGQATLAIGMRVNHQKARSSAYHVVSASFWPLDADGNLCRESTGKLLRGKIRGKLVTFTARAPGANAFLVQVKARVKVRGKFVTKPLTRRIYLGGTGYNCLVASTPPPSTQVCDWIGSDANGVGCGMLTSAEMPFWVGKPALQDGVISAPRFASRSGYCWQTGGAIAAIWLGQPVTYGFSYQCSTGQRVEITLYVYLSPVGSTDRDACSITIPLVTRLPTPASWGNGYIEPEFELNVTQYDSHGHQLGPAAYEYTNAIFHGTGTVDGCPDLATWPPNQNP